MPTVLSKGDSSTRATLQQKQHRHGISIQKSFDPAERLGDWTLSFSTCEDCKKCMQRRRSLNRHSVTQSNTNPIWKEIKKENTALFAEKVILENGIVGVTLMESIRGLDIQSKNTCSLSTG